MPRTRKEIHNEKETEQKEAAAIVQILTDREARSQLDSAFLTVDRAQLWSQDERTARERSCMLGTPSNMPIGPRNYPELNSGLFDHSGGRVATFSSSTPAPANFQTRADYAVGRPKSSCSSKATITTLASARHLKSSAPSMSPLSFNSIFSVESSRHEILSTYPHNTFEAVYMNRAKCDICDTHNKCVLQRCKTCKVQFCKDCMYGTALDVNGKHWANEDDLDWTPKLSSINWQKQKNYDANVLDVSDNRLIKLAVAALTSQKKEEEFRKTLPLSSVLKGGDEAEVEQALEDGIYQRVHLSTLYAPTITSATISAKDNSNKTSMARPETQFSSGPSNPEREIVVGQPAIAFAAYNTNSSKPVVSTERSSLIVSKADSLEMVRPVTSSENSYYNRTLSNNLELPKIPNDNFHCSRRPAFPMQIVSCKGIDEANKVVAANLLMRMYIEESFAKRQNFGILPEVEDDKNDKLPRVDVDPDETDEDIESFTQPVSINQTR